MSFNTIKTEERDGIYIINAEQAKGEKCHE